MTKNPFENEFIGVSEGNRVHGEAPHINQEALDKKRDEYVLDAVNAVSKEYSDEKMKKIAAFIDEDEDVEDREKEMAVDGFVTTVHNYLLKKHGMVSPELVTAGIIEPHDQKTSDKLDEIRATYPKDVIMGFLKAVMETGNY